jgi:hypothetical protein
MVVSFSALSADRIYLQEIFLVFNSVRSWFFTFFSLLSANNWKAYYYIVVKFCVVLYLVCIHNDVSSVLKCVWYAEKPSFQLLNVSFVTLNFPLLLNNSLRICVVWDVCIGFLSVVVRTKYTAVVWFSCIGRGERSRAEQGTTGQLCVWLEAI